MKIKKSTFFLFIYMLIWLMPSAMVLPTVLKVMLRLMLFGWLLIRMRRPNITVVLTSAYCLLSLISVLIADRSFENLLKTAAALSVFVGMTIFFLQHPKKDELLRQCFKIVSLFLIIDVFVLVFMPQGISQNVNGDPIYFSGGKFTASYLYMVWMMLFLLNKEKIKRTHIMLLTVLGTLYAFNMDCNTGALSIAFFGGMVLLPRFFTTKKRQTIWIAIMFALNYMIVFLQVQTTVPWISTFITDVLHRQTHMTGRVRIYDAINQIMEGHWLWGYGFTSDRIVEVTGLANMQNGLLQLIYTGGVVGMICYMAIMIIAIWKIQRIKNTYVSVCLIATLSAFLIVSIVEIPFTNSLFYLVLCCVFAISDEESDLLSALEVG